MCRSHARDDEFTRILHALPDDAIIIDLHGMADGSTPENISIGTGTKDSGQSAEIADRITTAFDGNAEVNGTLADKSSYKPHSSKQVILYRGVSSRNSNETHYPD